MEILLTTWDPAGFWARTLLHVVTELASQKTVFFLKKKSGLLSQPVSISSLLRDTNFRCRFHKNPLQDFLFPGSDYFRCVLIFFFFLQLGSQAVTFIDVNRPNFFIYMCHFDSACYMSYTYRSWLSNTNSAGQKNTYFGTSVHAVLVPCGFTERLF